MIALRRKTAQEPIDHTQANSVICNLCMKATPRHECRSFPFCHHTLDFACWEAFGSPSKCPFCEFTASEKIQDLPFLIVVREYLGKIFMARKITPLQAAKLATSRIVDKDHFQTYLMGMEIWNRWESDEQAVSAVIVTVASLAAVEDEQAFRQFATEYSLSMLGKNIMNGQDAQYIMLALYGEDI